MLGWAAPAPFKLSKPAGLYQRLSVGGERLGAIWVAGRRRRQVADKVHARRPAPAGPAALPGSSRLRARALEVGFARGVPHLRTAPCVRPSQAVSQRPHRSRPQLLWEAPLSLCGWRLRGRDRRDPEEVAGSQWRAKKKRDPRFQTELGLWLRMECPL